MPLAIDPQQKCDKYNPDHNVIVRISACRCRRQRKIVDAKTTQPHPSLFIWVFAFNLYANREPKKGTETIEYLS